MIGSQTAASLSNLPLSAGGEVVVVQVLGGVITDLFKLHEHGQDEATTGHAINILQTPGEIGHGTLIERGLRFRQTAFGPHLGLLRQVGGDVRIGLQSSQDVGPHQFSQAAKGGCVLLLVEPRDELLELLRGPEQSGTREVENRPQISQVVLDRCTGQHDAAGGIQFFHRFGLG